MIGPHPARHRYSVAGLSPACVTECDGAARIGFPSAMQRTVLAACVPSWTTLPNLIGIEIYDDAKKI
jgi:hypothetical protein